MALLGTSHGSTVEHPFILWTKEDATSIRKRLESEPDAQKQYEVTRAACLSSERLGGKAVPLWDLFLWMVKEDEAARDRQLQALRDFIGTQPEADDSGRWTVGNASANDAHMRDEQSMNVLRYDMLYEFLTEEEIAGIHDTFRVYIEFQLSGHRPIHPHFGYGRTDTLPNMHWPRAVGTHLMAVAMKDEELIDKVWNGYGGWFWFFDQYLADGFYMEEFAKYYSNIGTMMLICEGLERLGLGDKYGYGYVSRSGATVRDFLFMPPRISYPKTLLPGGMDHIAVVQMGDTPSKSPFHGIFGHSFVEGYLKPGYTGKGVPSGNLLFTGPRMNGPFPKMMAPLWCEVGHRRFPDAGFDWFLTQMRKPGEEKAYPTLLFGLEPITPSETTPPIPQSIVSRERGFAFLKSDETVNYWYSGNPAVALQFGMYYVHYAHDCFSLLGYHAFGRPLYARSWGSREKHPVNDNVASDGKGYIGGHAWFDTVRGHAGVTVDNLKPRPVDHGQAGTPNQRIRDNLTDDVKFVAVAAKGLYPDVWQERALFLTKEYMVDGFANRSDRQRRYEWGLSGAGTLSMPDWQPTSELNGSMLFRDLGESQPAGYEEKRDANDPREVHKLMAGSDAWSTHIIQDFTGVDVNTSALGPDWYGRQVGVRISMLGSEDDTTVFGGRPPLGTNGPLAEQPPYNETGGAWLNVRRDVDSTNFIALHQPFEKGAVPDTSVETIADTDELMALAIFGSGGIKQRAFNDRAFIATGPEVGQPRFVEYNDERYRFTDHLWIRIDTDVVTVVGYPLELNIPVKGNPAMTINGRKVGQAVNGRVVWKGQTSAPVQEQIAKPIFDDPIDRLIHELSDPNTGTRENASIKLARMGAEAERSIPSIIKGLTHYKTTGNKVAAETLSWMGEAALPHMKPLFDHQSPFVRAELLYGLQSYSGDLSALMPQVIERLNDENRYVRRNALKLVIQQGPAAASAVPVLVELLDDHINNRYAVYALSAVGKPALPSVIELLNDSKYQRSALRAIAGMEPEAIALATDAIAPFLDGPMASEALKAFSVLEDPTVAQIAAVVPLLASDSEATVNSAAIALYRWYPLPEGSVDPSSALLSAARTSEGVHRSAVIQALGNYPGSATTQLVIDSFSARPSFDDKKNGQRKLIEMGLAAAAEEIGGQLGFLFEFDERRDRYRHAPTLRAVLQNPAFPIATYQSELEAILDFRDVGLRSASAAALLSIDPGHKKAEEVLVAALDVIVHGKKRTQKSQRDAAWAQLALAHRNGWKLDWPAYLSHEDTELRARSLEALAYLPDLFSEHAEMISKELDNPDPLIAVASATALIKANAPQAEKAILTYAKLAHQFSWRERSAMVSELGLIAEGHKDVVLPELKVFAMDTDFFVRKAAEGAIYQLKKF